MSLGTLSHELQQKEFLAVLYLSKFRTTSVESPRKSRTDLNKSKGVEHTVCGASSSISTSRPSIDILSDDSRW